MRQLAILFLFVVSLASCSSENNGERSEEQVKRRAAVGELSELVIVGPKQQLKGLIGDTIVSFFRSPFPSIPQSEPSFDVRFVFDDGFNDYEKGQANIIVVSVGSKEQNREARVTQAKDAYARGQKVYTIYALNDIAFYDVFNKNKEALLKDLNDRATVRSAGQAEYANNGGLSGKVKEQFGIEMAIPEGFHIATQKENVISFKRTREKSLKYTRANSVRSHGILDGIVIYKFDHSSDSTFTLSNLVDLRDEVLSQIVQSDKGSPMYTEPHKYFRPTLENVDVDGVFATKMRGLWRFDSPVSGGPFVSLAFFNEKENYAVAIDAYVFTPKFDKRDYVRELEGILKSVHFPKETKEG